MMATKYGSRRRMQEALIQLLYLAVGILIAFPILYGLCVSFMEPTEILSKKPHMIPNSFHIKNYYDVFDLTILDRYIVNSMIVATCTSVVRLITGSLAAYAFAFFKFRGKNVIFFLMLGTMMIPSDATVVTNYLTVARMGLVNTYMGIMILSLASAMNIFMLRQYFLTVSTELKEAAAIDGSTNFGFYLRILLPVSKPALTTVFISSFVSMWNSYMWPMLVTNHNEMRTVQVGVTMLNFADNAAYGPTMAAAIIILIPSMLIFLMFRRQLVHGIAAGSVKG